MLFSDIFETFCFADILSIADILSLNVAAFSKSSFSDACFISSSNYFIILDVFPSNSIII